MPDTMVYVWNATDGVKKITQSNNGRNSELSNCLKIDDCSILFPHKLL